MYELTQIYQFLLIPFLKNYLALSLGYQFLYPKTFPSFLTYALKQLIFVLQTMVFMLFSFLMQLVFYMPKAQDHFVYNLNLEVTQTSLFQKILPTQAFINFCIVIYLVNELKVDFSLSFRTLIYLLLL
jgi:archaellum biogenesis protein FlaJ (TadC family)